MSCSTRQSEAPPSTWVHIVSGAQLVPPMNHSSRVYIAGHRGLVGSAPAGGLARRGYGDATAPSHQALDLRDARAVAQLLAETKPHVIFLAAARVGGILANETQPAEFIRDNLAIE